MSVYTDFMNGFITDEEFDDKKYEEDILLKEQEKQYYEQLEKQYHNKKSFLTIKELKEILKDIPDDYKVVLVGENLPHHIMYVTSIGHLSCKEEEYDAIGFMSGLENNIKNETDYCIKMLYNYKE